MDFFSIFCYKLKSCPIPGAEHIGYMNASHPLVLCLNTTGEQPTCGCSTAFPIQHQWVGEAWPGIPLHFHQPARQREWIRVYAASTHRLRAGRGPREAKARSCSPRTARERQSGCTASCVTPTSPGTGRAVASRQGGRGSAPPAPTSASPRACCFAGLSMLFTSYNATTSSSLSIQKRQQLPRVAELPLPKSERRGGAGNKACVIT